MDSEEIDLRQYIEILWKWKLIIVLLTAIAVVTSGVFSFFILSPVYQTKVTLSATNAAHNQQSIRQADSSVVDTVARIPTVTLNTYKNQIMSPYFLQRVLDELDHKDLTVGTLSSMLSAQIITDTSLIEVKVESTDRELATEIANEIASSFVSFVSENNQERMARSLDFLKEQKAIMEIEVVQAYASLKTLQERPENASYLKREITLQSQTMGNLREELVREQVQNALHQASLNELDHQLEIVPETLNGNQGEAPVPNPEYQRIFTLRNAKALEFAESSAKVIGLQSQIAGLNISLLAMEARLTTVQSEEEQAKADLGRLEDTLSLLNQKTVETQMAQSLNLGEASIDVISPALLPTNPIKPKKMLNMAVAGVLGGFTSILLAFVLEYMDNTIKTPDDVAKYLDLGTLGSIPMFTDENSLKVMNGR